MLSEMGSNFWFDSSQIKGNTNITPEIYGYTGSDYLWLYSGRSAISFALKTAEERNPNIKKVALLPPYTCHTVFNPFYYHDYQVESYEIDGHFVSTKDMILKRVDEVKPGVVLLQRYFGFETLTDAKELVEELRKRNIITIEDCTQVLFSNLQQLPVDYYVASVRKFFGTPDGGFVVCKDGLLNKNNLLEINEDRNNLYIEASNLKNDYISNYKVGEKKEFLELFSKAENMLDDDNTFRKISDVSLMIQSSNDIEFIKQRRKDNYKLLLNELKDVKGLRIVINNIDENETPLYMPIYIEGDRFEFQKYLKNASIYAPIVWPRPERIPNHIGEVADDFYNHVICLLIDQRYDESDIKRLALRVKMYFNNPIVEPDVFYTEEYLKLFYEVDGESYGIYKYDHKDGTVIYPYVLRKTPELDGKTYYDIITPRGFNGPCVVNQKKDDLSKLIDDYNKDFEKYCLNNNIIAEYIRFCPWTKNGQLFSKYYELRDNNQTLAIDLSVDDILMQQINSKRRNQIRLAQKKGVKVEFDFKGETVDNFYKLYQNTIEKNSIGNDYDFSLEFMKKHFDYLKNNCFIANAIVDNQIISSIYVLMWGDNMHYHLSANDYTKNEYNGNSLLLYEIAKLGKAFGCKYLHLGGVGVAKKSLMDFKMSFVKEDGVFPFYVSSKIRNKEIYDKLVKKHGTGNSNYFPAYRG